MRAAGLNTIYLVAPTSSTERMRAIAEASNGFLYAVSRTGVTGVRKNISMAVSDLVGRVRQQTSLPVAVGFGISTPEHVREVCGYADAAVVGSRLVLEIENNLGQAQLPKLVERVAHLARELKG